MRPRNPYLRDLPTLLWDQLEQKVQQFEDTWRHGERPELDRYLSGEGPGRCALLIELVRADLEFRLKAGEGIRIETYLQRYAELGQEREVLIDLLASEFLLRRRTEPQINLEELLQRFPECRQELTERLQALGLEIRPNDGNRPTVSGPVSLVESVSSGSTAEVRQHKRFDHEADRADLPKVPGYKILGVLGRGGMGIVYKAEHLRLQRVVALKMIRGGQADTEHLARFRAEALAVARLQHPNIVQIHEVGEHEQLPFFSLEFVEGDSLARKLDGTPLGGPQAAGLIETLARAMHAAHQRGIVHRDLKPGNVLLTADSIPKITDFGLAKQQDDDSGQTHTGAIMGTPSYMAPEQAAGESHRMDGRGDVYSLGVILYEMLTGELPFRGNQRMLLYQVLNDEPRAPRRLNDRIPRDLENICLKAMAKEPRRRYQTAGDLADDLRRFVRGEPVHARPVGRVDRVWRWCLRHPAAALLAVVVPTALLTGVWLVARAQANAELDRRTAELDRRNAELKEKAAAQITDYLVRIFQSADPLSVDAPGFHGPGNRTHEDTLRRILKQGAVLVNEHLQGQPKQRADLLHAMGCSYRNLGDWEKAQVLLKESYELRKAANDADHPDTLVSLQSLARLEQERGEYKNAIGLYEEVLARREKQHSPDHLLVVETKFFLAWVTFMQPLRKPGEAAFERNDLIKAERLLLDVLRVREATLPAHDRDLGHVLAALAAVKLYEGGQERAALGYATRALEVFRASEQDTLMGNVFLVFMRAELDGRANRIAEAEVGYSKVLKLTRRNLGDQHPLVAMQLWNLAGFYANKKKDLAAAERTAMEALDITRRLPQRNIPAAVDALLQMADIARNRDPLLAQSLYREAIEWAAERPEGNERNAAVAQARLEELKRNQPKPKTAPE